MNSTQGQEGIGPRMIRWAQDPVLVTCVMMLALNLWAISVIPVFERPDEPFHYAAVLTVSDGDGWPATADDLREERLPSRVARVRGQWDARYTAEAAPDRLGARVDLDRCRSEPATCSGRLTLSDWGPGDASAVNRAVQHPPLYYSITAAGLALTSGLLPAFYSMEAGQSVFLVRFLTVVVLVPVPWIAARVARELSMGRGAELMAAAITLSVPGVFYTGPGTISPDALLVLLASVATLLVVRLRNDPSRRELAVLGGVLGLTSFTKATGMVIVLAAAIVLAPTITRGRVRDVGKRLGLVGGVAFLFGGWWWLRNLLVLGNVQPLLSTPPGAAPVTLTSDRILESTVHWGERVLRSFWGLFLGIPATGDSLLAFWLLAGVLLMAIIGAVFLLDSTRMQMFSMLTIGGTILMMWTTMVLRLASTGTIKVIQGRYLYPMLVVFAVGFAGVVGRTVVARFDARPRVWGSLAAVTVLWWHSYAARAWMNRYADRGASFSEELSAWLAWFAPPLWLGIAIAVGVVVCSIYWLVCMARDPVVRALEEAGV